MANDTGSPDGAWWTCPIRGKGYLRYGYMLDHDGSTIVEDPEEQQVLIRAADFRAEGYTYEAIAAILNDEGEVHRGVPWEGHWLELLLDREPSS